MGDGETELSGKMRALAETHERGADLRRGADALDAATAGYFSLLPTVSITSFMAAWSRARMLYCALTGEKLV